MRHTLTLVNVIKSQKYSVYVLNNNTNITGTVTVSWIFHMVLVQDLFIPLLHDKLLLLTNQSVKFLTWFILT